MVSEAYASFHMTSDKVIGTKSKNNKFMEGRNSKTRINKRVNMFLPPCNLGEFRFSPCKKKKFRFQPYNLRFFRFRP